MTKSETLNALKGSTSPEQIDTSMLRDYYRHFAYVAEEDRDRIFGSVTREIIGVALKREWDNTCDLLSMGYNKVEAPIGAVIYRKRSSELHKKWQKQIPDTTSVRVCKQIFNEILDKWEF